MPWTATTVTDTVAALKVEPLRVMHQPTTVTVSALPSGYNAAGSAIRAAAGVVHRGGANSAADGSAPGAAVTPLPLLPLGWLRPWS